MKLSRARSPLAPGAIGLACALGLLAATAARAAKWDPVTPAELASKACPFDATAAAEILCWRVRVEGRVQVNEVETVQSHYVRVKVYTDAAAQEWTKHTLTLASSKVRVSGLVARTIQPDGSAVDMDPKSVSKEVVARVRGRKVKSITFALPAVTAGCIVEYRLQEVEDDAITEYVEFPLQGDLPARSIQYYLRPLAAEGWNQRKMVFHARLLPEKKQDDKFALLEVENMPAFRREPRIPPEGQVKAWMLVYYSNQPLSTPQKFWRDQSIAHAEFFDEVSKADDTVRKTAKSIVEGAQGPDAQLQRLVEWCRHEIRVTSSAPESLRAHHISPNKDVKAVLRQRAGTTFDVDMLFGALARALGFDVRYVRVPRRSRIYFDQEMMDLRFLPSFDIAVRVDGRWQFYDAQARRLPWNMLPWDEESQMALFCDRDSSMFLETPMSVPEQNIRRRSGELTLDEEGTLEGDVHVEASGHWNDILRGELLDTTDSLAVVRDRMDWKGDWLELSALRVDTGARESDPLRFTVHARIPSHAVRSGKRMLLEPTAWWAHREPEFGASKRTWPVEFQFAWSDVDSLRIRLPKGWKCETVSSPQGARAPGVAELQAEFLELESGAVLQVRRWFALGYNGQIVFPATSYSGLQKLFGLFNDSDR